MYMFIRIFDLLITVINTLILIRVILSWISPNSSNGFTELVYNLTEPILKPFRVLLPMGNFRLDIAPIIAYIFFGIVRKVVFMILL
ncbi:YggT family protein [Fusobacterium sp.]|uniref:YggT family protein n=1 Tax=Fusobacterium sp. TaxID=68766 RepID=UPI0028FF2D4C|nr:YggT family protein [Fusobacterium sp.]MDU1911533.1 YggT family protein [Fusobacterium sp.]